MKRKKIINLKQLKIYKIKLKRHTKRKINKLIIIKKRKKRKKCKTFIKKVHV